MGRPIKNQLNVKVIYCDDPEFETRPGYDPFHGLRGKERADAVWKQLLYQLARDAHHDMMYIYKYDQGCMEENQRWYDEVFLPEYEKAKAEGKNYRRTFGELYDIIDAYEKDHPIMYP